MRSVLFRHRRAAALGMTVLAVVATVLAPGAPGRAAPTCPPDAPGCPLPDKPAVIADPAELVIDEGSSGTFTVRLSHPPAQSVWLNMRAAGTGMWASPPVMITFTPANWHVPRSFSLMNVPDDDSVDDVAVVTLWATGFASDTITLTQLDRDRVR